MQETLSKYLRRCPKNYRTESWTDFPSEDIKDFTLRVLSELRTVTSMYSPLGVRLDGDVLRHCVERHQASVKGSGAARRMSVKMSAKDQNGQFSTQVADIIAYCRAVAAQLCAEEIDDRTIVTIERKKTCYLVKTLFPLPGGTSIRLLKASYGQNGKAEEGSDSDSDGDGEWEKTGKKSPRKRQVVCQSFDAEQFCVQLRVDFDGTMYFSSMFFAANYDAPTYNGKSKVWNVNDVLPNFEKPLSARANTSVLRSHHIQC